MHHRKLCILLLGLWTVAATCAPSRSAEKTLYRKASRYATLVVTENEHGLRTLRFGDDPDAQSVVKVGDPDHVEFEYVQAMPVALTLVQEPKRVLIVGLGGGSLPGLLRQHYPQMTIDVVDIDADVVAVAKKYFGFREDAAMHVYVEDGRRFIDKCQRPYDIIFLDAYGPENIPYDLATKEFLLAARRAVGPRGVVAGNVWRKLATRSTMPCCGPIRKPSTISMSSTLKPARTRSSSDCPTRKRSTVMNLPGGRRGFPECRNSASTSDSTWPTVSATRTQKIQASACCWTRTSPGINYGFLNNFCATRYRSFFHTGHS